MPTQYRSVGPRSSRSNTTLMISALSVGPRLEPAGVGGGGGAEAWSGFPASSLACARCHFWRCGTVVWEDVEPAVRTEPQTRSPRFGRTADPVLTAVLPVKWRGPPLGSALVWGQAGSSWLDFTSRRLSLAMGPRAGEVEGEEKSNT